MAVEVPPHVEEILGDYPALLEQWKAEMAQPCMHTPEWRGTLKRYLDPVFLKTVVREHVRLIEGDIERPGPELAAAIDKALDICDEVRRERAKRLADPWWRASSYTFNGIAEYHDPEFLRSRGEYYNRLADPFSPESIKLRSFVEQLKAGGTFEVTENATGAVVDTFTTEGSRPGAANRN